MYDNRIFLKSLLFGLILILLLFLSFIFFSTFEGSSLPSIVFVFILGPIILFCSMVFWLYNVIKYDKEKYGDEKRRWYSYFWYPSRKWDESIYFVGLSRVILAVPFIVYFCTIYIGGYSVYIGFYTSIFSLILSIILASVLNKWLESRNY